MTSRDRPARGRRAPSPEGAFSEFDPMSWLAVFDPAIWLAAAAIVAVSLALVGLMYLLEPGSAASSWLLATAIYIPCVIFAAMTLYFGRATPVKARLIAAGFALGGLAFAVWGGMTDYSMRAVTLFEVEVEGSTGGGPAARELSFAVEHPGAEHTLLFWPKMPGPGDPSFDAVVRVELRDAEGATLLEREELFELRYDDGADWGSASVRFTPAQAGGHTLLVTPVTPGIPLVHVRIEDPLKRDGERPVGY